MTPPQDDDWLPLLAALLEELPDDLEGERRAVYQYLVIHARQAKEPE